jgi:hypothetical protein
VCGAVLHVRLFYHEMKHTIFVAGVVRGHDLTPPFHVPRACVAPGRRYHSEIPRRKPHNIIPFRSYYFTSLIFLVPAKPEKGTAKSLAVCTKKRKLIFLKPHFRDGMRDYIALFICECAHIALLTVNICRRSFVFT